MTHWADEGRARQHPGQVDGRRPELLLPADAPAGAGHAHQIPRVVRTLGYGRRPRDWVLAYSNDNETFITPDDNSTAISVTQPISSSGFFFYYTVPLTPTINLTKGQTLYLKLYPTGKTSVNGGTAGYNSDSRLHSCFAIEAIPSFHTAKPAGASISNRSTT